ncbi:hypothetical protein [Parashewanella curva]|nr:hypothetical protein [Parashewanella curva]
MQLSASETIKLGLITGKDGELLRHEHYVGKSSVDLSVGEIIHKDEKGSSVVVEDYEILPQETVYLLSEQFINVKPGYVAYVFLKNRLSQGGLLALNTGIIDSGFNDPLSTLVTNFSKKNIEINSDEKTYFFRVVFHKISLGEYETLADFESKEYSYDIYKKYRKQDLRALPRFFLDPDSIKNKINDELSDKAIGIYTM